MKIGILGLPQVGKNTLFALLTGEQPQHRHAAGASGIRVGVAHIKDERLDRIAALYPDKKKIEAAIEIVLLPTCDKEALASGEFLQLLEHCDALCHVVRAFADDSVFHVKGSVDAERDIDAVFTELVLSDLLLVEKRLERLSKEIAHKQNPQQAREREILLQMKEALDAGRPLATVSLDEQQQYSMAHYQFLTRRPVIIVLNVTEVQVVDRALSARIEEKYSRYGVKAMQVSAKIETELVALEAQERQAFLNELHITEPAVNRLSRLCYEALGLISFFTVGKAEARAWTVRRGSSAPEAAGIIHSDMQRGFIRAEIMKSADLITMGSEAKVREAGRFLIKGKDYVLEDGDVMQVRFSV